MSSSVSSPELVCFIRPTHLKIGLMSNRSGFTGRDAGSLSISRSKQALCRLNTVINNITQYVHRVLAFSSSVVSRTRPSVAAQKFQAVTLKLLHRIISTLAFAVHH